MKPLIFVYDAGSKNSGSTAMRIFQLSQIAKSAGIISKIVSNEIDFNGISEAILLFSKNCGKWALENQALIKRIRNRNMLCYDPLDIFLEEKTLFYFDCILASSLTQYFYLSNYFPRIHPILHHYDLFLKPQNFEKTKTIGYFGETINMLTPKSRHLSNMIDIHHIDTTDQRKNSDWRSEAVKYDFHYTSRNSRPIDGYKPFTKGFNAAASNSIVVLHRPKKNSEEALLLGPDYPFYIEKNTDLSSPEAVTDFLYQDDSRRKHAMDIMRYLKELSSPEAISDQLLQFMATAS